jgi:hypothetical protein
MNPPAPVTRTRRFFHVDVVLNFLLSDRRLQAGARLSSPKIQRLSRRYLTAHPVEKFVEDYTSVL